MKHAEKQKESCEQTKEISEKELNEIMRAVAEQTKAQTIELKQLLRDNLRREIESAREAFQAHGEKRSQA
ncbi:MULTISPECIES: hypothetical protein [Geobacter]|uniref:hypothetical protein n=1 Tax=Geobacter TaxID=28231 RepID=UPI00257416C3|nr:hypothetical protein [Geobacter sulfurreducens]BEH11110.1 hypothetical protein GSUET_27220 [Geobacter sulfurreducens subsp. ethanolicus]BET58959.1 hypothetical protein GEO60473_19990 [Geobacter sp. 60473]HML79169.1 hypothetical protein [Geobacter sulfurreducens]